MPRAFVIMPFDSNLQAVYDGLIRRVLEEAGFDVRRADDLLSQRNILQDIIEAIEGADLVVADLTDNNANVFYELGIAHTRMRPTILMTQSVEDVPFDLRSYRLIPYSTHFADIDKARNMLSDFARAAMAGTLQFGSPVADFLRQADVAGAEPRVALGHPTEQEEAPRGFIDHAEALEDGLRRVTAIMSEVTEFTAVINESTRNAADEMARSQKGHAGGLPFGHLRRIATKLSAELTQFTEELAARNAEYRDIAETIDDSFEFMVHYSTHAEELAPTREQWMDTLKTTKEQGLGALAAYDDLADTMDGLPPFEKSLGRAIKEASRQVRQMADNMRLTIASIDRALVAAGQA